jgi:hypothetical protein
LLIVDGPSYVYKMVKIHHEKKLITSLIFILNFQINWIGFIMISKIKLKKFQIWYWNFYMFNVGIIIITFKFLLIKNNLFFQTFYLIFFIIFLLFTFFLEFALFFSIFPPTRIPRLWKFETKITCCLWREEVIQLFKHRISPN